MINLELSDDILNQNSSEFEELEEKNGQEEHVSNLPFLPRVPVRKTKPIRERKFRVNCRNFFFTFAKSPACFQKSDILEHLANICPDNLFIAVSKEMHKDGTPHFHALLMLPQKLDIGNPRYFDINYDWDKVFHPSFEAARDVQKSYDYITKEDKEPETRGTFVSKKNKGEEANRERRAELNFKLLTQPIKESIDSGLCSIFHYTKLRENILAYNNDHVTVPEYIPKENLWIVGDSGIGKSRWVRTAYPGGVKDFYFKAQNKWWDGYAGQKVVLIDDFDKSGRCLSHHLKIWADCYRFSAEVKGAYVFPYIEKLIITSQYTPEDLWGFSNPEGADHHVIEAINRRFKMMTIKNGELVPYYEA